MFKITITVAFLLQTCVAAAGSEGIRRFTVKDDIGLTVFEDPYTGHSDPITFSPDNRYFAVLTNRGLLKLNRCESAIRIWSVSDVRRFLKERNRLRPSDPLWTVRLATSKYGPVITHVRWLKDSTGLAFLGKSENGLDRLFLADIKTKKAHALTPSGQHVTGYDVRDSTHFVYTVLSRESYQSIFKKPALEFPGGSAGVYLSDSALKEFVARDTPPAISLSEHGHSDLWACVDGRRYPIRDPHTNKLLTIFWEGQQALALSPDGHKVITSLPVENVPSDWEKRYPPPPDISPAWSWRIRAGHQDLSKDDLSTFNYVSEYALIDLSTGTINRLIGAPTGHVAGWWSFVLAGWSSDGKSVVFTNTFLRRNAQSDVKPERPCVAVVELSNSASASCVRSLQAQTDQGYTYITDAAFVGKHDDRVSVRHFSRPVIVWGSTTYSRSKDGTWAADPAGAASEPDLTVTVKQSLNDRQVLLAADKKSGAQQTLWDPNPELARVDLGEASVFKWTDKNGRDWLGGLYKPPDYVQGNRYPLVIQTHGFVQDRFNPSGLYTTGYAARELAAHDIMVLQIPDCSLVGTPEEAPCNVAGFESAAEKLSEEGTVDRERVGLMGFSLSGFYVSQAIAFSSFPFKAATVNDGTSISYWEYLSAGWGGGGDYPNSVIGAAPFGEGLQTWLKRSPGFNLDRARASLLIATNGAGHAYPAWGDYATLRALGKPVEFFVVNDCEHELTTPKARLASQGVNVDWFDFWLNGHEDPAPEKADQYKRWRELRELKDKSSQPPLQNRAAR